MEIFKNIEKKKFYCIRSDWNFWHIRPLFESFSIFCEQNCKTVASQQNSLMQDDGFQCWLKFRVQEQSGNHYYEKDAEGFKESISETQI